MIAPTPKKTAASKGAREKSFLNGAGKEERKKVGILLKLLPDVLDRITAQAADLGMPRMAYILSTVIADMNRREKGKT